MQFICSKCGGRDIRPSQYRTFREFLKSWIGIHPIRCRVCRHRWQVSGWSKESWKYAHCPRCRRQALATWNERYYRPPLRTVMLLRLGAKAYRCVPCRCNFASFRPCRVPLERKPPGEAALQSPKKSLAKAQGTQRETFVCFAPLRETY